MLVLFNECMRGGQDKLTAINPDQVICVDQRGHWWISKQERREGMTRITCRGKTETTVTQSLEDVVQVLNGTYFENI